MSEDQIQLIQIDLIDRPVKIARDVIDPEKVRELAESIREHDLLEPVLLTPRNGRYEMVAGDRRYLAHRLLGRSEIKAIVREYDDREIIVIRGIENLQRENLTPSEEARYYLALKEDGGLNPGQIAKKTGRSRATVDRYLNFATCPDEVKRAVDRKEISLLVLETLMEIDDPVQLDYYFKMAVNGGINNTVARMWVDDYLKTKAGNYYLEEGSPSIPNVENVSKPAYMTCEVCLGPVEIKAVRSIVVCLECLKKVRHT